MKAIRSAVVAALVASAIFCAAVSTALAHHSYSKFLTDRVVSIEGEVREIVFVNPHVLLTLRTSDGRSLLAEWQSAKDLTRTGITGETLKVGDHLIVRGSPSRDPDLRMVSLLREVQRPSDGWHWTKDSR